MSDHKKRKKKVWFMKNVKKPKEAGKHLVFGSNLVKCVSSCSGTIPIRLN